MSAEHDFRRIECDFDAKTVNAAEGSQSALSWGAASTDGGEEPSPGALSS